MSIDSEEPVWWSWQQIIEHASRLGIPSFQRGAVWEDANRVALLESLYEQSPCGTFVLWESEDGQDPRRHGVPLRAFAGGAPPLWLVDGQQRTRAMLDTFDQLLGSHREGDALRLVREADMVALRAIGGSGPSEAEDEDEDGPADNDAEEAEQELHPWLVVLPAMRDFERDGSNEGGASKEGSLFGELSESKSVLRGSMFRRFHPRARKRKSAEGTERPVPPIPAGSIPLASLISPVSIFQDAETRRSTRATLDVVMSDASSDAPEAPEEALKLLDDVLPWGPQFATGHAYEAVDQPMVWRDLWRRRQETSIRKQVERLGKLLDGWKDVFDRFRGMLTGNRFAVGRLPGKHVSAAIDAYVRINRAGVRVRSEEQALALLSRARPKLLDDLAEFAERRDGGSRHADGRALLTHASERQMGFALWMATVTRFSALMLLGHAAREWLWTSAIDKSSFSYRLDRVGPAETPAGKATWARLFGSSDDLVEEAAGRASTALLLIDEVLSGELYLDHRMARPQVGVMQPIIDLFSRVPTAIVEGLRGDDSFRAALARVMHWTMLHPYIDKAEMDSLVDAIHGAESATSSMPAWGDAGHDSAHSAIRAALGRYVRRLEEIWLAERDAGAAREGHTTAARSEGLPGGQLSSLAADAFAAEVSSARTLQHRAVGWLYAIEHRNGARELSWANQFAGFEKGRFGIEPKPGRPSREEPLRRPETAELVQALRPEKQHIVPLAIASHIVGKGGTRATSSPANGIGNLTWLSQRQIGLEGLAERWAVLDPEIERDNLAARGLLASFDGEPRTPLDLYRELSDGLVGGREAWLPQRERWEQLFTAFCSKRCRWMVEQMRSWLDAELSPEASSWIDHRPSTRSHP